MKRQIVAGATFVFLCTAVSSASLRTQISYKSERLDHNRWQCTYDVENISLNEPIREFSIWFDLASYDKLAVETPDPLALNWNEIVWQPEPTVEDSGAYDALALNGGIETGQRASGFTVSFDWAGEGEPGSQAYEVIDPLTFETIDSGWTIPEPGTFLVFGPGILLSLAGRKKSSSCSRRK